MADGRACSILVCKYSLVCVCVWEFFILDEPLELLRIVRTAVVGGPGVADGELVELQHIHHPNLCHSTAEQVRTLVHTSRCVCVFKKICVTHIHSLYCLHCRTQSLLNSYLHTREEGISWVCVMPYGSQPLVNDVTKRCLMCCLIAKLIAAKQLTTVRWIWHYQLCQRCDLKNTKRSDQCSSDQRRTSDLSWHTVGFRHRDLQNAVCTVSSFKGWIELGEDLE